MAGDVTPYTGLITSEHADKPNFSAVVAAVCQGHADNIALLQSLPQAFDIDSAIGVQLDAVGQWVGVSRYVASPLSGVYFALDTPGVGFDQGIWWAPGEPTSGVTALPDDIYRLLLKARIIANQWDGTIPGAYAAWNALFAGQGLQILIQDNGDMTMTLALTGATNNPTFRALFSGGYLDLRPAGVEIDGYLYPSADAPIFGFDVENSSIAGFDVGAWAVSVIPDEVILYTESGIAITTEAGVLISV